MELFTSVDLLLVKETAHISAGLAIPDGKHCVKCRAAFTRKPEPDGEPGTIYSLEGLRETRITGMCETCFDGIFEDHEE